MCISEEVLHHYDSPTLSTRASGIPEERQKPIQGTDTRRRSGRDKHLRHLRNIHLYLRAFWTFVSRIAPLAFPQPRGGSARQRHVFYWVFSLLLSPAPKGYPQGSGDRCGLYRHYHPVAHCQNDRRPNNTINLTLKGIKTEQ